MSVAPDFPDLVERLHAILIADARTNGIHWHPHRVSVHGIQRYPAGALGLLDVDVREVTIPSGMRALTTLGVQVRYQRDAGVEQAERDAQAGLKALIQTLWANYTLGLDTLEFQSIRAAMTSNPEATPPHAEVTCQLVVAQRLQP